MRDIDLNHQPMARPAQLPAVLRVIFILCVVAAVGAAPAGVVLLLDGSGVAPGLAELIGMAALSREARVLLGFVALQLAVFESVLAASLGSRGPIVYGFVLGKTVVSFVLAVAILPLVSWSGLALVVPVGWALASLLGKPARRYYGLE